MQSLVIMGEYDDMKYLVRDGSKKLREATELPDDSLLAINRAREDMMMTEKLPSSPRKRGSSYGGSHRSSSSSNGGMHTPKRQSGYGGGNSSSAPPKLKGHPRDRPSSRSKDDKHSRRDSHHGDDSERRQEGDWGNALPVNLSRGFHSIWNCGATGEETGNISPTQVVSSPREGKSHSVGVPSNPHKPVFEGRDSHYGQTREGGVTTRAG